MSLQLQLLVLALEAALYPTLLAAVVILLAQPNPKRMIAAYLVGGFVMSVGAGMLIVYGLQSSGMLDGNESTLSWSADLALGGLALLLAVALARRADVRWAERRAAKRPAARPDADAEDREPWSARILARGSAPLVFAAGIAINVPGAAYLVALKSIAADDVAMGTTFVYLLVFNAIMFLMAELPLAGLILAPERTGAAVDGFNAWLSRNGRNVAIVVCAVLGGFLIVRGLLALP